MIRKLPARALFYAIIVAIFVALISSGMLLSSYHQHIVLNRAQTQERLINNCISATALVLGAQKDSLPQTVIDLFGEEKDSLLVAQKKWGLLDLVLLKSWAGQGFYKDSMTKAFFVGKQPPAYALTLSEGTKPLYVCGGTHIVGDAFLPREGVERGFVVGVKGRAYYREKLIFGKKKLVTAQDLNSLKSSFQTLEQIKQLPANCLELYDSMQQSFHQPTLVWRGENIVLGQQILRGNVVVIANREIEVEASAFLEDVILLAPSIKIQTGFQGNLQAFAWDSLIVEPNVQLHYPSVLSLLPRKERTNFSPNLTIAEGSELTGVLIAPNFVYQPYKTKVKIAADVVVRGQVWVNGLLEHAGAIYGSVFCDQFLLQTAAAIYENYLLDAVINRTELPQAYLAPIALGNGKTKKILKYTE